MPVGLVTRAVAGFFDVADEGGTRLCRARGVFKKKGIHVLVGDEVDYEPIGNKEGVIINVYPRKSELIRPPIANVDQVLLVFSLVSPEFQSYLLDTLLVHVSHAGLKPIIVFTKTDLTTDGDVSDKASPYINAGYEVISVAAKENRGIDEVMKTIEGHVTVLAGPSGVGKSTLANAISPELGLKMGEISDKLGRGKHTTRHVELYRMNQHTFIADAPGFSQLDVPLHPSELRIYFPDFLEYAENCAYRGCLHADEDECGVKAAVAKGHIAPIRYQNYGVMLSELRQREERKY